LHVVEYPWHEFVVRECLARSDYIVACSMNTFDGLRANYRDLELSRISVINNGIDFDEIESVEIDDDKNNGSNSSILFAGRLFWLKGIFHLLEAVRMLVSDFGDLNLKIFGIGPQEHNIMSLVSTMGLENHVFLQGRVAHKKLLAEIKKSALIVVPSHYEGQPMIALEAMACKKPVVAFSVPFAREIINDGYNGLWAQPFDAKDLSEKMRLLLTDRKKRLELGKNAYDYVKREHDWDVQAHKYFDVYEHVLSEAT
jgi:glycosyltransferase involved in cell wall biosynthesis